MAGLGWWEEHQGDNHPRTGIRNMLRRASGYQLSRPAHHDNSFSPVKPSLKICLLLETNVQILQSVRSTQSTGSISLFSALFFHIISSSQRKLVGFH